MFSVTVRDHMMIAHSFTGEDCVELHVHGSKAVLDRLYTILTELGLRLAESGEFRV